MTSSDTTPPEGEDTASAPTEAAPTEAAPTEAAPTKAAAKKAPVKKAAAKKTAAKKTTTKKVPATTTTAKPVAAADDASEADAALVDAATVTSEPAPPPAVVRAAEPTVPTEPTAPPLAPKEPQEAPAEQVEEPAAPRTRVIVAEDEALIRLDLVELLRDEGYDVVAEAGDGEVAVAKARELLPDLVVMDVQMPRMDGISAAKIIATERIAPVVMLTAFSQRELVERAREAGAMAYVVKPFEASDVVPAIEMAIARFHEIRAVEAEVEDLEERLASRKAVDQAKGLLQTDMGMTEQEAFRWIQKTAMDLRKSMREVAEGIIAHAKKQKKQ